MADIEHDELRRRERETIPLADQSLFPGLRALQMANIRRSRERLAAADTRFTDLPRRTSGASG